MTSTTAQPIIPSVTELAWEIEKMRLEAGLDTADLLDALREIREQIYTENYDRAA